MKEKTKKILSKLALGLVTITGIGFLAFGKKKEENKPIDLEDKQKDEQLFI